MAKKNSRIVESSAKLRLYENGVTTVMAKAQKLLESLRKRVEYKYASLLRKLWMQVKSIIKHAQTPVQAQMELHKLARSADFDYVARKAALKMATMTAVGQVSSWREAASKSSKGLEIYKALKRETTETALGAAISDIVQENATLIKTVPEKVAVKISELAQKRQMEGVRPEEIMKEIKRMAPHLTDVEARRLARTESAKAASALVEARAEKYGRQFYIWRTARDERVRDSHRAMNGVICRWSDPPDPEMMAGQKSYGKYPPGGIFNCRCIALPIISVKDIKFPAKVHMSGQISTVNNLTDFRKMFGLGEDEDVNNFAQYARKAAATKRQQDVIIG